MPKRKFRSLKDLFAVTEEVSERKITPVLKGGRRIQGLADESKNVIGMNMDSSSIDKSLDRHFPSGIFHKGAESGTCNVCATPCSSCIHFNRVPSLMGPKSDESSDEACQGKKASRCSFDDADLFSSFKSTSFNERQRTGSETSNLVSPCSSHISFSENAESKATLNASDISEDVEMLAKWEKQKESECDVESLQATAVFSNKSDPSDISSLRDVYADTISPKGEHFECSTEQVESSLARVEKVSFVGLQHDAHDFAESVKPKTEMGDGDPTAETANCLNQNEYFEKSSVSLVLPNLREPPLQSQATEYIDGSDIVDVKVCDICGDAGREDLLAICTKCTDGAEHIYCTCIKLDKVPKGDWMCEECMLGGKSVKQKQGDFEKVVGTSNGSFLLEISQNARKSSTSNCKNLLKLDIKDSSFKKSGTNKASPNPHFSAKRPAGNLVTSSVTKRRALETSVGSPRASSPCRKLLLSQDSSFKNLYEGKLKPGHHKSYPRGHCSTNILENERILTVSGHNSPKSQLQCQMSQGSLLKSSSFNIVDSRMKVQRPEQDVLQKQKFAREIVTGDRKKEGTVRVMSKSVSFSGATSDRANATDSKVKMISSNFSHVEDLKRLRNAKDQNSIRRKNSFRSDNPMVSSPVVGSDVSASKTVKKVTSCGDSILPLSSQSNCCDLKAAQCHRNSNNSSKPASNFAQEDSNCPNDSAGSDGVRRASSCSSDVVRDPSFFRISDSSHELKPNQVNLSNNVKDVAEAVTTRRHELHGKHRFPNQFDDLCMSNSNLDCQVASKDRLSTYSGCVSADGTNEGQDRVVNDVRQHVEYSTAIKVQNSNAAIPSYERPYKRGLPRFGPAVAASRITAVPELDYIWRGRFEMQRSGRLPILCDGIQAHLSTCASPKVLEAVKKLPHKVLLEEVSRLRTWPTQFLESCATEDNIALYFFAEDLESYGRNYKSLLKCMIENDLALRGSVDGIELLIFSSNLLPEKSQRWNKLSFLWGVFRGRRENYSEHKPNSQKMICIPNLNVVPVDQDLSVPSVSGSQNMLFPRQLGQRLSAPNVSYNTQEASNSVTQLELPSVSSGRINQICESRVSSPEQKCLGLQTNFDRQPTRVDAIPLSIIPKKNEQLSKDTQDNNTSLKEHRDPERRQDCKPCFQESRECDMDYVMVAKESECKRMKSSPSGTYERNSSGGERFSSGLSDFCPSFPINDQSCYDGSHDMEIKFTQVLSSDGKYRIESRVPNLELSLGAENKLAKPGIIPSFLGTPNKNNNDDEVLASLSLSLALPFSDKEEASKSISKPKQLLPERHGMNTSFLFGGFPNALDV